MLNMQKIFLCSVQWILHAVHDHFFYSTVSTGSDEYPGRAGQINAGDKKKNSVVQYCLFSKRFCVCVR